MELIFLINKIVATELVFNSIFPSSVENIEEGKYLF
jgi:hypothetical protein